MRKLPTLLSVAVLSAALASTKTTSTWSAKEIEPRTFNKVVVLAKITDDVAKRVLEDAVVKGLAGKGVSAVPAYQVLTPADLESQETIKAKAQELGADAGLVFTVTGQETQVKQKPQVYASVGVSAGGGPFGMFLGTSMPLGGGGTSTVQMTGVKAEFYAGGTGSPIWIGTYATDLKAGAQGEAQQMATQTVKGLHKAKVFKKK